jgi:hypothetical protein
MRVMPTEVAAPGVRSGLAVSYISYPESMSIDAEYPPELDR